MLAVDVDELLAEAPKLHDRTGRAIDVGPGLSVRRDDPAQHTMCAGRIQAVFSQPALGRVHLAGIECHRDFDRQVRASGHGTVRPGAECQVQRIDDDGFSGTGFSSEHAHAGMKVQLQFVDDCKISDVDGFEHGLRRRQRYFMPRGAAFQRSFSCSTLK